MGGRWWSMDTFILENKIFGHYWSRSLNHVKAGYSGEMEEVQRGQFR
jgi:hypothetical protein